MCTILGILTTVLIVLTFAPHGLADKEEKSGYCDEVGEKKFELHTHKLNWYQALEYCLAKGMRLATINSAKEQERLVTQIKALNVLLTDRWWIGGADLGTPGNYFWFSTAEPFNYTNFNTQQPDNYIFENGEDEHCMELRTEWKYNWNDFVCHYRQFFVCHYYSN